MTNKQKNHEAAKDLLALCDSVWNLSKYTTKTRLVLRAGVFDSLRDAATRVSCDSSLKYIKAESLPINERIPHLARLLGYYNEQRDVERSAFTSFQALLANENYDRSKGNDAAMTLHQSLRRHGLSRRPKIVRCRESLVTSPTSFLMFVGYQQKSFEYLYNQKYTEYADFQHMHNLWAVAVSKLLLNHLKHYSNAYYSEAGFIEALSKFMTDKGFDNAMGVVQWARSIVYQHFSNYEDEYSPIVDYSELEKPKAWDVYFSHI